jgi:hypothetical protein
LTLRSFSGGKTVFERWCYPIPIAMQRHTGSHLDEPVPLKLAPMTSPKIDEIVKKTKATEPCQADGGTRD